jgi:hypothetical protein
MYWSLKSGESGKFTSVRPNITPILEKSRRLGAKDQGCAEQARDFQAVMVSHRGHVLRPNS